MKLTQCLSKISQRSFASAMDIMEKVSGISGSGDVDDEMRTDRRKSRRNFVKNLARNILVKKILWERKFSRIFRSKNAFNYPQKSPPISALLFSFSRKDIGGGRMHQ